MIKEINYKGEPIIVSNEGEIWAPSKTVIYSNGRKYHYPMYKTKAYIDRGGYLETTINRQHIKVHRAVAMAFLPNPDNLREINHKDEDKTNNYVYVNEDGTVDMEKSNLEWCDSKYNNNYGTGNQRRADKLGQKVLCVETGVIYTSMNEAGKQLGHPRGTGIRDCCKGRQKSAYGYTWRYIY